jgi:hypothetical protein
MRASIVRPVGGVTVTGAPAAADGRVTRPVNSAAAAKMRSAGAALETDLEAR